MRMAAIIAAVMVSLSAWTKKQDVGGVVTDENGLPLPFVNVVLLSLPDSAFVQGAVTDEQGVFNIVTKRSEGLLKLSSIGYETLYIPYQAADRLTIRMREDATVLGEVVVKGDLPKTYAKGDAMRTTVAGSILRRPGR